MNEMEKVLRTIQANALQAAIEMTLVRLHSALWILSEREPDKTIHLNKEEIDRYKARFDTEQATEAPRVRFQNTDDGQGVVVTQDPVDMAPGRAESHSDSAPMSPEVGRPEPATYKVH